MYTKFQLDVWKTKTRFSRCKFSLVLHDIKNMPKYLHENVFSIIKMYHNTLINETFEKHYTSIYKTCELIIFNIVSDIFHQPIHRKLFLRKS